VLFLIPPSETKVAGGTGDSEFLQKLTFDSLAPARRAVLASVVKAADAEVDLDGGVMPAIERYSGTLYSAIHGRGLKGTPTANDSLSADQIAQAADQIFIQSALFGLISAADPIPSYKISPTKKLGALSLKKHWQEAHEPLWANLSDRLIIDLRSKAYADLAPIGAGGSNIFSVDVFYRSGQGQLSQMNHFNKKAKGQLVRAALLAKTAPKNIKDLTRAAAGVGLELIQDGQKLTLITRQAT
jgi:cytoplasmic iron level regulating protein YaaA (DUF328/UPF0246 family)